VLEVRWSWGTKICKDRTLSILDRADYFCGCGDWPKKGQISKVLECLASLCGRKSKAREGLPPEQM
jgi:hypothetical protein